MEEFDASELRELKIEYRTEVAREWALAARDVAKRANIPFGLKVWEFLNNRTTIGVPDVDGGVSYFFTEEPKGLIDEYAFLTPLINDDATRLHEDDFRYGYAIGDPPHVAQYREGSRAIYFSEKLLTKNGKGIIMLHEAAHAMNDIRGVYNRDNPESHWLEEADVYSFEFELLATLGDDAYGSLVDACLKDIRYDKEKDFLSFPNIDTARSQALWNELFGGDISAKESRLWDYVTEIHAFYRYMQQNFDNARAEFARYLKETQGRPE